MITRSAFDDCERFYRSIDALYRLHDDVYHVEDAILRSTAVNVRLAKNRNQTGIGAAVAATLTIVPILISVSELEWASLPIIWTFLVAAGLVVFLLFQVRDAQRAADELRITEELSDITPLERRFDYQLEQINALAHRIRIIEDLEREIASELDAAGDDLGKNRWNVRLNRYREIRAYCQESMEGIVEDSLRLVQAGTRSREEHTELLDWAAPYRQP